MAIHAAECMLGASILLNFCFLIEISRAGHGILDSCDFARIVSASRFLNFLFAHLEQAKHCVELNMNLAP
jgi:hypothetical protein